MTYKDQKIKNECSMWNDRHLRIFAIIGVQITILDLSRNLWIPAIAGLISNRLIRIPSKSAEQKTIAYAIIVQYIVSHVCIVLYFNLYGVNEYNNSMNFLILAVVTYLSQIIALIPNFITMFGV